MYIYICTYLKIFNDFKYVDQFVLGIEIFIKEYNN